ncbi:uncharacterized protein LOC141883884, partial [Acropora palmata]|uniref:uncharacterized protein LOC141883884 n=1 Tax=Acropora palmata TaxID=6131 RepID=UPI003DA1ACA8
RNKEAKKKPIEDHKDSDDIEECDEDSQLAGSSSQDWLANHASIINEKMCPSVSYWIALTTPNGAPTSPLAIHRALLECRVDVFTNQVTCREGKESLAMKELFKVLKDHNNTFMAELVESSYRHCFEHEFEKFLGEAQSQDLEECGAENVVRVCLVDHSFQSSLSLAVEKLQEARLVIDQFGFRGHDSSSQVARETGIEQARLSDKLTVLINDIGIAMKKLGYALYGGKVYKKCERAKYSYWYKCEMEAFINSLAANETFKDRLLKDMRKVSEILSNPHCEVIRPLCVDYNLIEVNDGQCWSIMDRRFVDNAIADKDIGHITPRAFSPYDPTKEPDPKYFKEILENSLSAVEVQLFCEDFLKLLNHNKKRHKDKVPCLVGAANSGKTSLFQPILGLVHHHNVATITKQRVFNKAMINRFTEVIFIDEACPSTLDIDDWKILTQGGYTACDVKYKTAKSFINRCPMLLTAQKKLEFPPEDQPAMDRRLRSYTFKSLPKPRKRAAEWLRRHPMECVVWASKQASTSSDRDESSDSSDEEDIESQVDDGILKEEEKDALRTLGLVDDECDAETVQAGDEMASLDEDGSSYDSDAGQGIRNLRHALEQTCTGSLRHRQLSHLLEMQLEKLERVRQAQENSYKQRQQALMSRGVTREHAALLPRDPSEPMPSQIANDLEVHRREALRDEIKRKMQRAVENPWLVRTEKELQECTVKLNGSKIDHENRASVQAYREVLQDKLKNFHRNLGTLNCEFALDGRRRCCVSQGLLKKDQRHLVTDLFQCLPIAEDACESIGTEEDGNEAASSGYRSNTTASQNCPSQRGDTSGEEMFITPVPSSRLRPCYAATSASSFRHDLAISEDLMRTGTTRKRTKSGERARVGKKKPQKTLLSYFSQK